MAGIPGHGIWGLMDAFNEDESKIPFIQTYHEQSAVHLADGYYRVSGKPMAAVTSIGAGASNTVLGLATAYSDSTSVLVITGGPPRHMRGRGVLQELERQKDNGFPQIAEAVSKRSWVANSIEDLPFIMHRAFSAMLTGRRGPAHIEVPWDVQAETAEVNFHDLDRRLPVGLQYPDPEAIERAVDLLATAQRPVIVVGGGAISADATDEVRALAEGLDIPVVTTWNGKSAFPEDHDSVRRQRRPDRHHPRQLPGRQRRRRGLHRVPVHRLVFLQLRTGPVLLVPAGQAHPHRHRPARDRQELPRRSRHPRRRQARRRRDRRLVAQPSRTVPSTSPRWPSARPTGRTSSPPAATPTGSRSRSNVRSRRCAA